MARINAGVRQADYSDPPELEEATSGNTKTHTHQNDLKKEIGAGTRLARQGESRSQPTNFTNSAASGGISRVTLYDLARGYGRLIVRAAVILATTREADHAVAFRYLRYVPAISCPLVFAAYQARARRLSPARPEVVP